ncbi:hypothetical protein FBF27_01905 [Candidatus Saccharibacteria bacterium oral taxon 488]|nr:hypothetical protein FBF27_01905 [Candidatus Saccharibacteria bacterium oral taxon 488]
MNIETAPRASQEPTDKRYPASGTNVGAPSEHELDIVNPNEIYIVNAPDKLDVIRQQILSPPDPEQAMLCLVYAEIVIEAIQNILESELAGLLDNTEGKNRLARQVLLNEAGLPGPLPLIFTSDKSGLLRQLYYESLDRVDSIYHDDELDVSQKQAALGEIADVMNKLQNSMMILAKEEIAAPEDPNERLFSPLD